MFATLLVSALSTASAKDDGLALTPPMGYRTWNDMHGDVSDAKVRAVVDAVVRKRAHQSGVPTSLFDLGYTRVGTDDGWQACGTGWAPAGLKPSFHAQDGTPLVNKTIFPDMAAMVKYGHDKGVEMDFYLDNCICMDEYTLQADPEWGAKSYLGDAQLLIDSGFDGVKIDNCGDDQGKGFVARTEDLWNRSVHLLVENSNQGDGNPMFNHGKPPGPPRENPANGSDFCPYHMFRSGGDIGPDYGNIYGKLQFAKPYLDPKTPISRPGCWAFPDMLEVGNFNGPLAVTESRTHFGAWCVVSSPLFISFDVTNDKRFPTQLLDQVWPIISNREAIAVNQEWGGHPGRLAAEGPNWQAWAKPYSHPTGGRIAAVVLSAPGASKPLDISIKYSDLGVCNTNVHYQIRDVWAQADIGFTTGCNSTWDIKALAVHDSKFFTFSLAM
eukprot:gene2598-3301_t